MVFVGINKPYVINNGKCLLIIFICCFFYSYSSYAMVCEDENEEQRIKEYYLHNVPFLEGWLENVKITFLGTLGNKVWAKWHEKRVSFVSHPFVFILCRYYLQSFLA